MENKIKDLVDRITNASWLAGYHMARENSTPAAEYEAVSQGHVNELLAILAVPVNPPRLEPGDGEENYDFDELFDAP